MIRQNGKKLTGVFAAALLATLGVGTLPAIAASDGVTAQTGMHGNDSDHHDSDNDSDHHGGHHHGGHHHDGHHHDGDHDGDHHDGDHDGDHHDGDHHDGDHHDGDQDHHMHDGGKHEGKNEDRDKEKEKRDGKHHKKHKNAFRLATSDGKRCVEASGKLEKCKHDDPDQLWFRKDVDSGWRLVNVGQKTCLGAHPSNENRDIKQEKCTDSLRQVWIPFGGPGMQKAPFVNAQFRSKALGRDDRVQLTKIKHAPKWQWLNP
jgi:hypothetical protein